MTRGVLDTSVVIDLVDLPSDALPEESAISVATLAELHTGVLLAPTPDARLARARFVHQVEALYRALSVDGNPEFATVLKVLKALGLKLAALEDDDKAA